eukprot:CAMPEP_0204526060 /NCGR_PEP_ID=MMETSP0661-20131031/8236_1 /ASSEMBLY_ACC=CAM_ASM_000606 /TAXON_ID=109239 /ORGANISM="Alexandrium margalefi, Strain AMGDE01CS-322" /LENGTH=350 /DNA_ID=CAMNT_0051531887 /DNA_START=39 /DNA_END=1091 /DNA_ORIENTATION=+
MAGSKLPESSGEVPAQEAAAGAAGKAEAGKSEAIPPHTPIQTPEGQVLPGSADELKEMANGALNSGQIVKAVHLYTMAIDLLARDMPRDQNGVASDANLQAWNKSSSGQLAKLLSNRSMAYLKQGDTEAAIEDADACTRADPAFEKGHLRLAVALESAAAPLPQQLEACERAVEACPTSQPLVARKWRLKKAAATQPTAPGPQDTGAGAGAGVAPTAVEEAQRLADDESDSRRAAAAADLGAVLAVGAHGLQKDLHRAEHYLRIGSAGGEIAAQRRLGLLLLELGRPVEAAQELTAAAAAGDEEAADTLRQLVGEASQKEVEARAKLEEMAEGGDVRAQQMLEELRAGGA